MKPLKRTLAIVLAGIMLLCTGLLAGCGAKTLEGTYTASYSLEEITSNTFHNGFVTALGGVEVNTVTFTKDGNYSYTKEVHSEGEDDGLLLTYTFTGSYTADGGNAVLNFPTKCEFSEEWGSLATMGLLKNSAGTYTYENGAGAGDIVQCKEDESHVPMDLFMGPYLLDTLTTSESGFDANKCKMTLTLDNSAKTMGYVVVNTDDE